MPKWGRECTVIKVPFNVVLLAYQALYRKGIWPVKS